MKMRLKTRLDNRARALADNLHDALMVRRSHLDTPMSAQTAQQFNAEHIKHMEAMRTTALKDLVRQIEEERVCRAMSDALTSPPRDLGHDDMLDAIRYGVGLSHFNSGVMHPPHVI